MVGRLLVRVEPPALPRVGAPPGDIEPVPLVAADVVVDQSRFEPGCAGPPVAGKVVDQVARHDLAHPVGQITGGGQFTQAGIDERMARISRTPPEEGLRVVPGRRLTAERARSK